MSSSVWLLTRSKPSNSTLPRTRCNGASHGSVGASNVKLATWSFSNKDTFVSSQGSPQIMQRALSCFCTPQGAPKFHLKSYLSASEAGKVSAKSGSFSAPPNQCPAPANPTRNHKKVGGL